MPRLVRHLLLENVAPSEVCPEALFKSLKLSEEVRDTARQGLDGSAEVAILSRSSALSTQACASLRVAVDCNRQTKCDTVDGAPDHQLNLSREDLEAIIGVPATDALWQLP